MRKGQRPIGAGLHKMPPRFDLLMERLNVAIKELEHWCRIFLEKGCERFGTRFPGLVETLHLYGFTTIDGERWELAAQKWSQVYVRQQQRSLLDEALTDFKVNVRWSTFELKWHGRLGAFVFRCHGLPKSSKGEKTRCQNCTAVWRIAHEVLGKHEWHLKPAQ